MNIGYKTFQNEKVTLEREYLAHVGLAETAAR